MIGRSEPFAWGKAVFQPFVQEFLCSANRLDEVQALSESCSDGCGQSAARAVRMVRTDASLLQAHWGLARKAEPVDNQFGVVLLFGKMTAFEENSLGSEPQQALQNSGDVLAGPERGIVRKTVLLREGLGVSRSASGSMRLRSASTASSCRSG